MSSLLQAATPWAPDVPLPCGALPPRHRGPPSLGTSNLRRDSASGMAPGYQPLSLCRTFGCGDRPLHPSLPCRGFLRGVCTHTLSNRFPLSSPCHRTNSKHPPPCPGTAPHSSSTACSLSFCTLACVQTHTHRYTLVHARYTRAHTHTQRDPCTWHTYPCTPVCTCIHICTHTFRHRSHTRAHTCHTHTRTHKDTWDVYTHTNTKVM